MAGVEEVKAEVAEEADTLMVLDPFSFRSSLMEKFKTLVVQEHNGPMQYLHSRYASPEEQATFAQRLLEAFPKQDEIEYCTSWPPANNDSFFVHISDLGFSTTSTTKPPPYAHTATSLADEFAVNTFVSEGLQCV